MLVDDDGAATFTTLAHGDDHKTISTFAPNAAVFSSGDKVKEPGGPRAHPSSERFNEEAKNIKDSELDMRTEAGEASSGAEMAQDVMLSDAPAPPAVAGRTPDGEDAAVKDLESDDVRTSGSGDSVSAGIGMADLTGDTRNLMKEGVAGSSLTQPDSRSPAAPRANAARDNFDQDAIALLEGSSNEKATIIGLRVEEHDKGIAYEDLAGSVQVYIDATLRLFGQGLTADSEVLFTAKPSDGPDEMCSEHLSRAFKVSVAVILMVLRC